jgi:branched-chain amino acid aminotransferase
MILFFMLAYLNGRFVPTDEAKVSVFDHGFLYGDGVYETMRSYGGKIFLLGRHLSRLKQSADAVSLPLPLPLEKIGEALQESLTVNKLREAYLRIQISRGPGEIGLDPALCPAPTLVILVKPFKDYPPALYENGVNVAVVGTRRNHPLALNPAIKSTNFLNNILAKIESLKVGAYEGIMLNWKGYVAEGTISNIFAVRKQVLVTPSLDTGILDGITRDLVLFLAKKSKVSVREELLRSRDLAKADECFITNTTVEIMPVTSIDGKPVGTGSPGPITRNLLSAYRNEVQRNV